MSRAEDARRAHASFVGVVRALGLLRPDTTPCGQPMSITEAHALGELHTAGALSQQDLADRLRLQKSTVSRLIDGLVTDGLVARGDNPADRRSRLVELTARGRNRAERLSAARLELFSQLLHGMTVADRRTVVAGLDRLEEAARALD